MYPNLAKAHAAYRQASASVHPAVAQVKIYDELILAIRQAMRSIDDKQPEAAFSKVMRAAFILRGLIAALDMERGGDVSKRLLKVYTSYIFNLHLSYGKPDVIERYGKLLDGLLPLREAWVHVAKYRMAEESAGKSVVAAAG